MYYKITNTECEEYKKLHAMRTEELPWEEENQKAIEEKTGMTWSNFLGKGGQQNFNRVTTYEGFIFLEEEKINPKIWKAHKIYSECSVPNKRTKLGREMSAFLNNGLKSQRFCAVFDILKTEMPNICSFPFVEIRGEVIILCLDGKLKLNTPDLIEITSKEFEELRTVNT